MIDGEKAMDLMSTMAGLAYALNGEEVTFALKRTGQEMTIVVRGE